MEKKNKLGDEVENGFIDDIGEKKTIIKTEYLREILRCKKASKKTLLTRSGRKEHQCAQNSQKNYI